MSPNKPRTWRSASRSDGATSVPEEPPQRSDSPPTPGLKPPAVDPLAADPNVAPAGFDDPVGAAVRRFEEAVARSRQHDHEVDEIRARLNRARLTVDRSYDAKGYLQTSSRQVDGQKVHVLIGPDGVPVAYLDIPIGIPTAPLLARRIGVRGSIRYDETLGARLIKVRDLDPLDPEG